MSLIEVSGLGKSYGPLKAVQNLSFAVEKGEILSLVGPDGAGKTSTFRAICGLISFDEGDIRIAGHDITRDYEKIKPLLGYMPQTFSLYPDLSVEENLYFYAGMFGLSRHEFDGKKKRLYEFSALGPFRDRRAGALSGGMKQKLALSCALIHDPQVLILDEPTTGVDPLSRKQFWDILSSLKAGDSTIIVATPYMDEVALCDRAIFIYQGHKLAEGVPEELVGKFAGTVYNVVLNPTSERMARLNQIEGISSRRFGSSIHLYLSPDKQIDSYFDKLQEIGIDPAMIQPIRPELEDTFIQLMER